MTSQARISRLAILIACSVSSYGSCDDYASLANVRDRLDRTVWAQEVAAQRHERVIVSLWDDLRRSTNQLRKLQQFPLGSVKIGAPVKSESLDLGIQRIRFSGATEDAVGSGKVRVLDGEQWKQLLQEFLEQGYQLTETEWHHSSFSQKNGSASSIVDFVLHLLHRGHGRKIDESPRIIVRGKLQIDWLKPKGPHQKTESDLPAVAQVVVLDMEILKRDSGPMFQPALTFRRRPNDVASAHPVIVHDLNVDGLPEIIVSRWNRVYWNDGDGEFTEGHLLDTPIRLTESGLIEDLNRDGVSDFVTVDKQGQVIVFFGGRTVDRLGRFPDPHVTVSDVRIPNPSVMTAGDVDGDGDSDLFIAQYKPAYLNGQMPTPYYDANDGEPSYLLLNNGTGYFADATTKSGLDTHRKRRTYSASFTDFDGDHDLDLVKVSDYAGIDLYQNEGNGRFVESTAKLVDRRHLFGMAHSFGDYNLDGRLDIYAIGMSSTTARRLDAMRLGRKDRADIHEMRAAMGFGNRMHLWNGNRFEPPNFGSQVARTGWSWGTASADFDLDGDEDIYVANGFRTGHSCEDYCSTFWRHDIYTGDSEDSKPVADLFINSMRSLNAGQISWNGYEHNAFLLNLDGHGFANVGFLLGVGCEFDSRSVVATDLDADGLPDLIVSDYRFAGRGFITSVHVFRNMLKTDRSWIGVRLRPEASSPGVMGATATVEANGSRQVQQLVSGDSFLAQHDNVFHFGLGHSGQVDRVTVRLPGGDEVVLDQPAINRYHDLPRDASE